MNNKSDLWRPSNHFGRSIFCKVAIIHVEALRNGVRKAGHHSSGLCGRRFLAQRVAVLGVDLALLCAERTGVHQSSSPTSQEQNPGFQAIFWELIQRFWVIILTKGGLGRKWGGRLCREEGPSLCKVNGYPPPEMNRLCLVCICLLPSLVIC